MREQNNGIGEDNILHNQFTKYYATAVRNLKKQYLDAKVLCETNELPLELNEMESEQGNEPDLLENLSLIEQLEDFRLQKSLRKAKTRDVHIFLAKALGEQSLAEIAKELGISIHTATSAYYRMVRKLRREIGGVGK